MDRQSRRRCPDETGGLTVQPGDPRPRPITTLGQPPVSLHVSELRHWAHKIARLSDGQYRWLMGEIRRTKKSLRTGKPARVLRSRIKVDSRDIRTSLAVRDQGGWQCRSCKRQFERPGSGVLQPGETSGLTNAHIISRSYKRTRYLVENGLPLCWGKCAPYFTEHPKEWEAFCRREIGDAEYDRLYRLAHGVKEIGQ